MTESSESKYDLILIGGSAGSLTNVIDILEELNDKFNLPIVIVLHQLKENTNLLKYVLSNKTRINITEPSDKEVIMKNSIYIAPTDYHLMIERDKSFSYSYDEPVNFSRPSIDILFETAAEAYRERLTGILLSGANSDGTEGLKKVKEYGGLTIVQDPATAEYSSMPESAIKNSKIDLILSTDGIKTFLSNLK